MKMMRKDLKIGLVCQSSFSYAGGIQEHVLALAQHFKKRGLRVKILTPRSRVGEKYGREVSLVGGCLNFSGLIGTHATLSFADATTLQDYLETEKFDLLHLHNPFTPFLPWQTLERFNGPTVGTLHANLQSEESRFLPFAVDFLNLLVAPRLSRFIAVSQAARACLWPQYWPRTSVIPNGIDLRRFSPRQKPLPRWRDGCLNILYVGRFDERKGVMYLLEAFRKAQQSRAASLRLLLVGNGSLLSLCREKVRREKIKNVVFCGYVSREDLPHYYATADIFCSPAIFGESFGMVLLEAMATGKPVVAFDIAGYREVLVGEGARFLVAPKDTEGLARKLLELAESEKLRSEMGEWGRVEAEKYSWDKVGEQVLTVYREALGGDKGNEYH